MILTLAKMFNLNFIKPLDLTPRLQRLLEKTEQARHHHTQKKASNNVRHSKKQLGRLQQVRTSSQKALWKNERDSKDLTRCV